MDIGFNYFFLKKKLRGWTCLMEDTCLIYSGHQKDGFQEHPIYFESTPYRLDESTGVIYLSFPTKWSGVTYIYIYIL